MRATASSAAATAATGSDCPRRRRQQDPPCLRPQRRIRRPRRPRGRGRPSVNREMISDELFCRQLSPTSFRASAISIRHGHQVGFPQAKNAIFISNWACGFCLSS